MGSIDAVGGRLLSPKEVEVALYRACSLARENMNREEHHESS
jgi:hypothetical protein